jgi:hypothetical protein
MPFSGNHIMVPGAVLASAMRVNVFVLISDQLAFSLWLIRHDSLLTLYVALFFFQQNQ